MRRYPPLVFLLVALFLALAVLPSALNLPQTNPSTTLEYAPVPPSDDDVAPPGGNLSSLGLATSGTLGASIDGGPAPVSVGGASGVGKNPSTKRCVGKPPRQTEDPLSPPCVAYFQGDNFGGTYPGVTRDEVRVLFYLDGVSYAGAACQSGHGYCLPGNLYVDLAKPAPANEWKGTRALRAYQRYVNDRYQSYGRTLHFYAYYARDYTLTPEQRRADAADNFEKVRPFAVVSTVQSSWEPYVEAMASRGVVNFTPGPTRLFIGWQDASFFSKYPKRIWSAGTSRQIAARIFSSYVCRRVLGHPVSFSGNSGDMAKPRVLGLLTNSDPVQPQMVAFGKDVRAGVEACGGRFAVEAQNSHYCGPCTGTGQDEALANVARFRNAGVTTIVMAGTLEDNTSNTAAAQSWYPEVVVAGDGINDSTNIGIANNASFWRNVFAVSSYERADVLRNRPCYQAYREADAQSPDADVSDMGCELLYGVTRMLATGVQVAGPRLNPDSMDAGFHAIPPVASTDPHVASCYFDPGDYTCIKDAQSEWWDPSGRDPSYPSNGCYRLTEGGRRYRASDWERADVPAHRTPPDPCNSQGSAATTNFQ